MSHGVDGVAIAVFAFFFALVTVLGFVAARWRRGDLTQLNEWGLAGRKFGSVVTWFLLGGDVYTAYTFIAVPALVFAVGAQGFFALPYTIIVYPLVFILMPRLWAVAHRHGYVTPADFVKGRYGSSSLSLATALTGLLATMPYIALQLVGIRVVIAAMGIKGDWPLIIAFVILAVYTYQSGLRAPALISIVKDTLIYITVLVAVIYIPYKLGGFGKIFDAASSALPHKTGPTGKPGALIPGTDAAYGAYATLALGSAAALFMYPHVITGVLSSGSRNVIRRNATVLPAYTFLLGLIALLGYMAIAAKIKPSSPNSVVPDLFVKYFPSWFEGFAFAAIAIGALVPAAIMSIAAANLFTRNVYREYLRPGCSDAEQSQVAKLTSLVVKAGAVAFILGLPTKYAIDLQLLGGVWILQTLPAIVFGLFTRWLHRWALLAGWAAGMAVGTLMAVNLDFKSSVYELHIFGTSITAYEAIFAVVLNLVVAVGLTVVLHLLRVRRGDDETAPEDYEEIRGRPPGEAPALAG
ncbi:MAG: sodium:solute symporter [Actinomycetota bacterium]|nr:sodium:solute symporter [Actinomycetota bacterium]